MNKIYHFASVILLVLAMALIILVNMNGQIKETSEFKTNSTYGNYLLIDQNSSLIGSDVTLIGSYHTNYAGDRCIFEQVRLNHIITDGGGMMVFVKNNLEISRTSSWKSINLNGILAKGTFQNSKMPCLVLVEN